MIPDKIYGINAAKEVAYAKRKPIWNSSYGRREEDRASISADRCIGCGLCVSTCPMEALSMEEKADIPAPPREWLTDTFSAIREESRMLKEMP